jgi:glycerol-1-phosphate dehydrogenase [NAD(P)+]
MVLSACLQQNAGIHMYMSDDAIDAFADFAFHHANQHLVLVADKNTQNAVGKEVERALKDKSVNAYTVVLNGKSDHVIADAGSVLDVLVALEPETNYIAAIGSGTITDIVRFVSLKTKLPFICIPTAASVDAYTSNTTSLTVKGVKQSFQGVQPEAIFMDLGTLREAPDIMTAAGFGDMLAKYSAIADWKLAHLLVDEAYDEQLVQYVKGALQRCVDHVEDIGARTENGMRVLMDSLNVSGFCMAKAKKSRPASGSEHSLSHYWEMTHQKGDPHLALHGTRTGVAAGVIADLYKSIRNLTRDQAAQRIMKSTYPNSESERAGLQQVFGERGGEIWNCGFSFLGLSQADFSQLKRKILDRWDEIVEIARQVPPKERIVSLLHQVGGASTPQEIGISAEKVEQAYRWAPYLRSRFTVLELIRILNLIDHRTYAVEKGMGGVVGW